MLVCFRLLYDGVYIEIEQLTMNDAGKYTCLAENPAGRAETSFDIDVSGRIFLDSRQNKTFINEYWICLVAPVFNDSLTEIRLQSSINGTAKLSCLVYGFPKPTVQWFFNMNLLLNEQQEELLLENIQVWNYVKQFSISRIWYLDQQYGYIWMHCNE